LETFKFSSLLAWGKVAFERWIFGFPRVTFSTDRVNWVLGLYPEDSRGADNKTVSTGGDVMES